MQKKAQIVEIQDSAATKVREFLESHNENIEDFQTRKDTVDKEREAGNV